MKHSHFPLPLIDFAGAFTAGYRCGSTTDFANVYERVLFHAN